MTSEEIRYTWRGNVTDDELSTLHAAAFGHAGLTESWNDRLGRHSLGWVIARWGTHVVGFVNAVGDGGRHAFLVDTAVSPTHQRAGIGRALVRHAIAGCRDSGAAWVHVDFEPHLASFYLTPTTFASTPAGLMDLTVEK
ncbi:MAG: GNAT family N-acetyltransferase [Jatrophihabitans sp.]